ncbi:hypothetical protein Tco_1265543 [Tanacetum coccineum]
MVQSMVMAWLLVKAHNAALDDGVVLVKRCGYFFLNWSSRSHVNSGPLLEFHRTLINGLSRGSFDVLVGMDRLSKRKFGIVCHGKVVRIPLEGDEILQVHDERTQGVMKTLMNTKVDEQKLSDISAVQDSLMCF